MCNLPPSTLHACFSCRDCVKGLRNFWWARITKCKRSLCRHSNVFDHMDASRERIAGAVPAWVTQLPAAFQQDFASGSCHRDLLNAVGSLHQHLGILHQHQRDLLNGQQDVINEMNILKRFVSEIKTQLDGHEVTYPIPIVTCTRLEMLTYASVTEGNACN